MHLPEPFFLQRAAAGQRLCILHRPATPQALACVVQVHAFGEEMNKCRRMSALQSRALAQAGCAVLQIDLAGCGDSSGTPDSVAWADWLADLHAACDWLQALHAGAPLWLWGQRAGALLAAAAAAQRGAACNLLLWQPVASGWQLLQQLLRLKAAASLAEGDSAAAKAAGLAARQALAAGQPLDVAGYRLAAPLLLALEQATLEPTPLPARLVWLELSGRSDPALAPASQPLLARWRAAGHAVDARCLAGPAFWQATEVELAPALLAATVDALGGNAAAALAALRGQLPAETAARAAAAGAPAASGAAVRAGG